MQENHIAFHFSFTEWSLPAAYNSPFFSFTHTHTKYAYKTGLICLDYEYPKSREIHIILLLQYWNAK